MLPSGKRESSGPGFSFEDEEFADLAVSLSEERA